MLSKFNKLLLLSLAILVVTACTKDEIVDDNRLPEGQYPLQISGVTLDVESTAQPWNAPQSRVTEDNSDGMSSVWQWDGSEMIGVQLGNETANYTLNADKTLLPDQQLYWTSKAPATVTGGSPTIYLDNANINISSGNDINITSGNPTIYVLGNNSIVSNFTNNRASGIYVATGSSLTISGNNREEDVLRVTGATDGAAIGGYSTVDGQHTNCGNITISNVTVYAEAMPAAR